MWWYLRLRYYEKSRDVRNSLVRNRRLRLAGHVLRTPESRPASIAAVRSVTLNLANKFSQCTFSVAEHYELGLIILRQAWWRRSYDVIPHRPHRTDRETAAGEAQRYHTDLKLMICCLSCHTRRVDNSVDGQFKSVRNNRRRLYKTATPTR